MPPPYVIPGGPGYTRALVLDGQRVGIQPPDLRLTPAAIADMQDMMDGSARRWERRPYFDGVANHSDRYTVTLALEWIDEADRRIVEECRVRGGVHRLTIWRTIPVIWTCKAGTQRYYLPRFRKCAAHLYEGLQLDSGIFATTANFPATITLNGDALAVTYAVGPTLTDPGAGGVVIAKLPDTSGEALDYTALRLGDTVVTGDELLAWMCVSLECSMQQVEITLEGVTESHAYTFVEL